MKRRTHKGNIYYEITPEEAIEILQTNEKSTDGGYHPFGAFVVKEEFNGKQGYAAIDNRCGDAWTEWFGSLGSALNWIYKYN